jgi:hypothetical protein
LAQPVGIHQVTKNVDGTGVREIVFLLFEFLNQRSEKLGETLLLRGPLILAQ